MVKIVRGWKIVAMALAAWAAQAGAGQVQMTGKIETVTVYRGQALVTRVIDVAAPAGTVDLVVTDLPEQILPGSLYASGSAEALIRAVRYRVQAVQDEPRAEVRKIDEQLDALAKELRELAAAEALAVQKRQYLDKLETFSTGKAVKEVDAGTLKVETLVGLTDFLFKTRTELSADTLKRQEKQRELAEKTALLERQKAALTARGSRTAREAVLFIEKKGAANVTARLHYLVNGANWSPTYTARTAAKGGKVDLEYSALVQQLSGEDWDGVKLTLSTASPSMLASAPVLAPLWVTLAAGRDGAKDISSYVAGQHEFSSQLKGALRQRDAEQAIEQRSGGAADWNINDPANKLQILDLQADKDVIRSAQLSPAGEDVLSVSYELAGPISLPSRNDQQMIQIAAPRLDAEFYYLAVPLLTTFIYQQADVTNSSSIALLAGPVATYMEGQFMGRGELPMVAKGQRFTLGFGVDSQLRARRELADKSEKTQGGNRLQTFNYRISISNFKDAPVKVRVMDRLPDPRGADIKVTLGQAATPLSDDKLYQQTLRKMGILQWEIEAPAKAFGATAKTLDYDYTLEFDRNMRIAEPSAATVEKEKLEFHRNLERYQMQAK